ncbi:helix-turn-helix domain-containing protein [Vibrio coralliilyticus]|uniref:helix-turn-helix domain-containing protein n=1 Tax=Vibrio coralliilyticus TaxID=190893 RepID=UPI0039176363
MSAIERATELVGGQTSLAKLLGVKQSHVWNWINRKHQAPAKYISAISRVTEGKVSIEELLADHSDNIAI